MKVLISTLVLVILFLSSCALEQVSPVDYNDAIFVQQMKVKNLITDLTKAPDDEVRKQIIDELKIQTINSLEKVKEIGPFREDDQLLKAAIPLFNYYVVLVHETLDVPIGQIPKILDASIQEQADFEQRFWRAQGAFAEEYELFL
jgi:hypothetical protein